jgi:Conserved TM helix
MKDVVLRSLDKTFGKFGDMLLQFLPHLLVMLIIFVVGWFVAIILKFLTRRIFAFVNVSRLSKDAGISQILSKADLPPAGALFSSLVFWVVWFGFLLIGVDALGVPELQLEVGKFFLFLPQIFVALLVLFGGLLAANFFSRAALLAAVNANLPSARAISGFVRFIIILLAVAMALEQIALARSTVLITFAIAFGAIMLALAIAFGSGGRDAAHRMLDRMFPPSEPKKEEERAKQEEISPL